MRRSWAAAFALWLSVFGVASVGATLADDRGPQPVFSAAPQRIVSLLPALTDCSISMVKRTICNHYLVSLPARFPFHIFSNLMRTLFQFL